MVLPELNELNNGIIMQDRRSARIFAHALFETHYYITTLQALTDCLASIGSCSDTDLKDVPCALRLVASDLEQLGGFIQELEGVFVDKNRLPLSYGKGWKNVLHREETV